MINVELSKFNNSQFARGAPLLKEAVWMVVSNFLVESWLPGSSWRITILELFGARIGVGCVIKPRIKIKFPWKLIVGKHSWIGEAVWIDNLDQVSIGDNVCISQGVYICTGSHDWSDCYFRLTTAPVKLMDYSWICAKAAIAPASMIGQGAVISFGLSFSGHAEPWTIYSRRSNPKPRVVSN